jgi:putative ABC transport system permease protein
VLAVIGLTSLLTASLLGQRDHQRDVAVLRVMGLTPVQVRVALIMRTTVLGLVAVTLGTVAGRMAGLELVSAVSRMYGLGAGLGRPPSAGTLALAAALAVGVAALAGVLPPRVAGRVPAAELLGP